MDQNADIWAKFGHFWLKIHLGPKVNFLCGITIFVDRAYHQYIRGYSFPNQTTPKKNSVSDLWVIFRGSTRFLAVSGHSHFAIISTLNFGPSSTKLGGIVWAINGPGPCQNYGETAIFMFGRKVIFFSRKKSVFLPPKKHQKFAKCPAKSGCFFGP